MREGWDLMNATQRLFNTTRTVSSALVALAIALSLIFTSLFGSGNLGWQVALALIALLIGIPHGALDHLVTLPKAIPLKLSLFILIYVLIAAASIWAILNWNVLGFQVVVIMSALHFGIGDAAFIAESARLNSEPDSSIMLRLVYAIPAGALPVLIPLTSDKTNSALAQVNPKIVNWSGSNTSIIHILVLAITFLSIAILLYMRDYKSVRDLILLAILALLTPPLVAFAIYFGLWHALRHTARLTLNLPKSIAAYELNDPVRAFWQAVIPGLPALAGTFGVAIFLASRNSENSKILWSTLVVVWALTVPHMMVTAKLDKGALIK